MVEWVNENILILVKTYPHPSSTYGELVCVAGITEQGEWRRLYPVPFRDLPAYRQFRKYSWVNVDVAKRKEDLRPESYQPNIESVEIANWVDTKHYWRARREFVETLSVSTVSELERGRSGDGASLGVVVPSDVIDIEVTEVGDRWSEEDRGKLNQLKLGDSVAKALTKIPFEFRYVFMCEDDVKPRRALITDWELSMRYLNGLKNRDAHEAAAEVRDFYLKLMDKSNFDTRLFMGTTHPYNKWIVVGLFRPPKMKQSALI